MNNISVGWHLLGVAVIIGLLVFVPDTHQSADFVFGERINNSGLLRRLDDGPRILVPGAADRLPARDVHADGLRRVGPHRRGDAERGDRGGTGRVASVFFSALIGWFVILAFLFAANDVTAVNDSAGFVGEIFTTSLDPWAAKLVVLNRDRRAALLRRGGTDQRVAHLVRVLARPRHARLDAVPARQPRQGSVQRRDRASRFSRSLSRSRRCSARTTSRSRSSRSPVSAPSVSTSPTSSPCICGIGRATRSRPGRGTWEAGTSWSTFWRSSSSSSWSSASTCRYTPDRAALERRTSTRRVVNYTPLAILIPLIFGVWYLISAQNRYQGPVRTLEEDEVTRD